MSFLTDPETLLLRARRKWVDPAFRERPVPTEARPSEVRREIPKELDAAQYDVDADRRVLDATDKLARAQTRTDGIRAAESAAEAHAASLRPAVDEAQLQFDAGLGTAAAIAAAKKPLAKAEDELRKARAASTLHARELASLEGDVSATRDRVTTELGALRHRHECEEVWALATALDAAEAAAKRLQTRWMQATHTAAPLHWPEVITRGHPVNPSRLDAWREEVAVYLRHRANGNHND
jgi:hypothetical protein